MNYFVTLKDGTVVQVGGVLNIKVVTPLIPNGTYRDEPAIVTGGAAAVSTTTPPETMTVAGGTTPTVQGSLDYIISPSSVVQSDSYAHVAPRFAFGPIPMVVFTTQNAIASEPVDADFPMAVPVTNFRVYEFDCVFLISEIRGWTNVPPPGFTPATYTPP